MKAFVLGLDHTTQQRDNAGRLEVIIRKLCDDRKVSLIAEEWKIDRYDDENEEAWTVGRKIAAERSSFAWLNMDIGTKVRKRLGIYRDLNRRIGTYSEDAEIVSYIYFPRADCLREHRWLRKIVRHKRNNSVLVLCGNIHVKPFASKLHEAGFDVAIESLCEHQWYRDWPYSKCVEVEEGHVDERY
jgi:hypothetical protein